MRGLGKNEHMNKYILFIHTYVFFFMGTCSNSSLIVKYGIEVSDLYHYWYSIAVLDKKWSLILIY